MSVMRYRKVGSEIQSNLLKISREGNYSFQGPIKSTTSTELKTWYINNSNGKEVATFLISGKRVQTMTSKYINFLSTSNEIPSTNQNPNTNWVQNHCTNEILILDVNSDKNSLTIIYMRLKMYCLKNVVNLI